MARWSIRTTARSRAIAVAVALLVGAVATAGCAPVATESEESGAQQTQPTPSPAPPAPGPVGPVAPDEPSEPDPVLSWVPPGPASPGDPPAQAWYRLLRDRACVELESAVRDGFGEPIWEAAAATCTAMSGGDDTAWADASARVDALGDPPADPGHDGCHGAAVHLALQRAIAFHEEHPEIRDVSTTPAEGIACEQELRRVSPQDPSGVQTECSPWFQLDGRLLPSTVVTVDGGEEQNVVVGEFEYVYFQMPLGSPGQESTIQAWTPDGELIGTATYTRPDPDPCSSPSPSPSPTAQG